jgi:surface protein
MAFMVSLLCVVIFGITSLSIMIDSNIYDNICLYKFDGASAFNQYIGNWNVGSVTNMESMVSNSCVCVYLT